MKFVILLIKPVKFLMLLHQLVPFCHWIQLQTGLKDRPFEHKTLMQNWHQLLLHSRRNHEPAL